MPQNNEKKTTSAATGSTNDQLTAQKNQDLLLQVPAPSSDKVLLQKDTNQNADLLAVTRTESQDIPGQPAASEHINFHSASTEAMREHRQGQEVQ